MLNLFGLEGSVGAYSSGGNSGVKIMAGHLVIVLQDGRVEMVAADFQTDLSCVVVSPESCPAIQGEPWNRPVDSLRTGKRGNVQVTPVRIEFLPDAVQVIVGAGEASKAELLELLKPGGRQ